MADTLVAIARKGITRGNKEVRGKYNIKAGDMKKTQRVKKNKESLEVSMIISSYPIAMYKFAGQSFVARTKGRKIYYGASAKPFKRSGRIKFKDSFPAVMKSGHLGIFSKGNKRMASNSKRWLIKERMMKTPTYMFDELGKDAMFAYIDDNLIDEFYKKYKVKAWRASR